MSTLATRLQESWRAIQDAERQRGLALINAADDVTVAAAQVAYEQALEQFRHTQVEIFTVALGSLELMREEIEALSVVIGEVRAIVRK